MNEHFQKLFDKRKELEKELSRIKDCIGIMQAECKHDWNTSNISYQGGFVICDKCGFIWEVIEYRPIVCFN